MKKKKGGRITQKEQIRRLKISIGRYKNESIKQKERIEELERTVKFLDRESKRQQKKFLKSYKKFKKRCGFWSRLFGGKIKIGQP